jgi:hypothetical protein
MFTGFSPFRQSNGLNLTVNVSRDRQCRFTSFSSYFTLTFVVSSWGHVGRGWYFMGKKIAITLKY